MKHKKAAVLLIIFLILKAVTILAAEPVTIDDTLSKIIITKHIEYIEDNNNKLTIGDIKSKSLNWNTSNNDSLNFGFTNSSYWFRFTINNILHNDKNWILEIDNPLFVIVELYFPDARGNYTAIKTGIDYTFKSRDVPYRNYVFQLKQKPGEAIYYLRIRTQTPFNFSTIIWSTKAFIKKLNAELPMYWLFFGLMVVMFIYNLFIFMSVRDKAYIYCALFILFLTILELHLNGFAYQYLWPDSIWWEKHYPLFLIAFVVICLVRYIQSFSETKINFPLLHKFAFYVSIIPGFILGIASLFLISEKYFRTVFLLWLAGTAIFGLFAIIYGSFKANRASRFIGLGLLAFIFGAIIDTLYQVGIMKFTTQIQFGHQIGTSLMVIIFSLGLADKINVLKNQLQVFNENLEGKVRDRTEALEEAMKELEVVNETILSSNEKLEDTQHLAKIDMKMAANVQASMLPKQAPKTGTLDIAFAFKPMSAVSGDFYDFYEINGHFVGVGLFDVSGHGVASALITMIARSVFIRNIKAGIKEPLNKVLEKSNKDLINEIGNVDNYITGILLRFNGDSIEYVNAGHSDLIYKRCATGEVGIVNKEEDTIKGFFMGVVGVDHPYDSLSFTMEENDTLLLYTDCLYEGRNTDDEEYGLSRLKKSLKQAPDGSAQEVLDYILKEFYMFTGLHELADDLTVIVIKKTA